MERSLIDFRSSTVVRANQLVQVFASTNTTTIDSRRKLTAHIDAADFCPSLPDHVFVSSRRHGLGNQFRVP
jgi:hypothetical protein